MVLSLKEITHLSEIPIIFHSSISNLQLIAQIKTENIRHFNII